MTYKPRNRFAQPFLVGALSSTFLGGCISLETTSNPPPPKSECPDAVPSEGSSCQGFVSGLACDTPEGDCVDIRCSEDGEWELVKDSCNPSPPITECPDNLPAEGASCADFEAGLVCGESEDSCDGVRCSPDGEWELVANSCDPPAPITECPDDFPAVGSSCADFASSLVCGGSEDSCDGVRCSPDGEWELVANSCDPPAPITECPTLTPPDGSSCANYEQGLTCTEEGSPDCPIPEQSTSFKCTTEGTWKVTGPTLSCNPPPPDEGE